MLRLAFFLSLGVLTGGILYGSVTGDPEIGWYLGLGIPVTVILGVLFLTVRSTRGLFQAAHLDIPKAMREGRGALARVAKRQRTGTSINDVHVYTLTLVVQAPDRDPYTVLTRELISEDRLYALEPGKVIVVARYALDRPEVAIVEEPDGSWLAAMEESGANIPRSAPLWEPPNEPIPGQPKPILGQGPHGRSLRIVLYAVMLAIGLSVAIVPNWGQFRVEAAAMFTEHGDDFTRNDRQQEAVDAVIAFMGHSTVTHVGVYDGYVIVEGLTSPGAVTVDDYFYRYGEARREGPTLIQPDPLAEKTFDLRSIDVTRIPEYVAAAIAATGIEPKDAPYVGIDRFADSVAIQVSVSDDYFQGWYRLDAAGNVTFMDGGRPGSAAEQWEKAHE